MGKVTHAITAIALAATGAGAGAQELSPEIFNARDYVADLNVVAANWTEGKLTNADVVVIAAVGCGTVRKIAADNLLGHAARWIDAAGYPEPGRVQETEMKDFVAFEINAFRESGATDAAVGLVEQTLWGLASLPVEAPSFEMELFTQSGVERRYCDARMIGEADPAAPASDAQVVLAGAILDSVVGAATITVDALISTGSAGADAGFIAILSGGVGYDLIKRGAGL